MNRMIPKGYPLAGSATIIMALIITTGVAWCQPAEAESAAETAVSWDGGRAPVSIVTNGWVEVREILPAVAAKAGLGLQMAPDVEGKVNVHLVDVPVLRALDSMLHPAGLGYEIVAGVLVVHKEGLVTRWFSFDYPVTQRTGRGELEVSASAAQGSGGSSGGGGGEGGSMNKSHVTSTATMSIWPEVMASVKTLVFMGQVMEAGQAGDAVTQSVNISDTEGRSLVANPMAGLIQVTAEFDRVQRIEDLITRLNEALARQVAIEVRIMEVSLNEDTKTGINWGTLSNSDMRSDLNTLNLTNNIGENYFQFVLESSRLDGTLQAISTTGDIKTLSAPRITTLNNQKAVVRVVREDVYYEALVEPAVIANGVATEPVVSYTPRSFSVGVVLDVTPQVAEDGTITLNVHPTITDVVGVATSPNADTTPILSVRELDTVGKVQAGQTLVIAGLLSERSQLERSGIPLLKDIPLLGYLFSRTHSQNYNIELVMLLTPVLLEGEKADALADAEQRRLEAELNGES